jgi:hypothetical protein
MKTEQLDCPELRKAVDTPTGLRGSKWPDISLPLTRLMQRSRRMVISVGLEQKRHQVAWWSIPIDFLSTLTFSHPLR